MYPTLRAEMARKNITARQMVKELRVLGVNMTETTFSFKVNGKSEFDLTECHAIKAVLKTDLPLEALFEVEEKAVEGL